MQNNAYGLVKTLPTIKSLGNCRILARILKFHSYFLPLPIDDVLSATQSAVQNYLEICRFGSKKIIRPFVFLYAKNRG